MGFSGAQRPHKIRTPSVPQQAVADAGALQAATSGLQQRVVELKERCRRLTWEMAESKRQTQRLQQKLSLAEGDNRDLRQGARPLSARDLDSIGSVVRETLLTTKSALKQSNMSEHSVDSVTAGEGQDQVHWTVAGWLTSQGVPELIASMLLHHLQSVEAAGERSSSTSTATSGASELPFVESLGRHGSRDLIVALLR